MDKRKVGSGYEEAAARFLISKGYQIVEHNFQCKMGEIDLIAREENYLVFIEVKYRASDRQGGPFLAVNRQKQRKISRTAQFYLATHGYSDMTACRFDVVGITGNKVRLVRNAFDFLP